MPRDQWELLIIDNASHERLADLWDISWHSRNRHVREEQLGLTHARLRGIKEAAGELLIFVDDDNVLDPDYLDAAFALHSSNAELGVFGAGVLAPEFEIPPRKELGHHLRLLAIRSVSGERRSRDPGEYEAIPWGAGLCVRRSVAVEYIDVLSNLEIAPMLDRRGTLLFSGGDDLFSWVAATRGSAFGIFPSLRVTHLISASRLTQRYMLRMIHDHTFSGVVRHFVFERVPPPRRSLTRRLRLPLHALKNGMFSLRCQLAAMRAEHEAKQYIREKRLKPVGRTAATGSR